MKIALLGGEPVYVARFRGHLLRALHSRGHSVVAFAGGRDPDAERELAAAGIRLRCFLFDRPGMRPSRELRTLIQLQRMLADERPDLVITTTPKLIAYGGIAARLARIPRRVAMVTGLGMAFDRPRGMFELLRNRSAEMLLRAGLRDSSLVVFYNPDDQHRLLELGVISAAQPSLQLAGSGVDTEHFSASAVPVEPIVFLLLGRLLRSKGVLDFIAAARRVKAVHPEVRFQLLGDLDASHPHSIGRAELDNAQRAGVEYLGYLSDVRPHLRAATVVVAPSQQREGMPRVILEAFATGRPVIASDIPGCRHAVTVGETGWLVPARSPQALAQTMLTVVSQPAQAVAFGVTCRARAEQCFAVQTITAQLLEALGA